MRAGFRKLATLYQGTGASIQPASAAAGGMAVEEEVRRGRGKSHETCRAAPSAPGSSESSTRRWRQANCLARAGVGRIASVDASSSYLAAQRAEAERLGYAPRASYLSGDFVTLADHIPDSDIVTLDRVICCYPDMRSLVSLSAARARRLCGIVYPRGTWWNAVGVPPCSRRRGRRHPRPGPASSVSAADPRLERRRLLALTSPVPPCTGRRRGRAPPAPGRGRSRLAH